jgi:hypothetical protein
MTFFEFMSFFTFLFQFMLDLDSNKEAEPDPETGGRQELHKEPFEQLIHLLFTQVSLLFMSYLVNSAATLMSTLSQSFPQHFCKIVYCGRTSPGALEVVTRLEEPYDLVLLLESDVMCCVVGRSHPRAQYVRGGDAAGGALPTRFTRV